MIPNVRKEAVAPLCCTEIKSFPGYQYLKHKYRVVCCQAENMLSFNPDIDSSMCQMIMAFPSEVHSNSTVLVTPQHSNSTQQQRQITCCLILLLLGKCTKCCKVSDLACCPTLNRTRVKARTFSFSLGLCVTQLLTETARAVSCIRKKPSRLPAISH